MDSSLPAALSGFGLAGYAPQVCSTSGSKRLMACPATLSRTFFLTDRLAAWHGRLPSAWPKPPL